ncbi:hypothetical protein AB1K70_05530 [Bremerella sp. JC770]|uniref:hypothetical protein n=1 Tax=Bremerella sp. JC770 TaxID=3232137 RepID=UPI003458D9E0
MPALTFVLLWFCSMEVGVQMAKGQSAETPKTVLHGMLCEHSHRGEKYKVIAMYAEDESAGEFTSRIMLICPDKEVTTEHPIKVKGLSDSMEVTAGGRTKQFPFHSVVYFKPNSGFQVISYDWKLPDEKGDIRTSIRKDFREFVLKCGS